MLAVKTAPKVFFSLVDLLPNVDLGIDFLVTNRSDILKLKSDYIEDLEHRSPLDRDPQLEVLFETVHQTSFETVRISVL